jgi:hypothetical protein
MSNVVSIDVVANVLESRCRVCQLYQSDRDLFWALHERRNAGMSPIALWRFLRNKGYQCATSTVYTHFTRRTKRKQMTHAEQIARALQIAERSGHIAHQRREFIEKQPEAKASLIASDALDIVYAKLLEIEARVSEGGELNEEDWEHIKDCVRIAQQTQRGVSDITQSRLREMQAALKEFEVKSREKERWREFLVWLEGRLPEPLWSGVRQHLLKLEGAANVPEHRRRTVARK